jgi:Tol biopolymer transport system component
MSRRRTMRGARPAALAACVAFVFVLATCAPAGADVFGTISLVSASPFQQVEYARDPAISGDGRYVVFDGSIGGVTGVWRRENRPGGSLEQVAGGDAELPSISHDGQFISFTTNEGARLSEITDGLADPSHQTLEAPNVYVRDMSKQPGQEGAFILASPLAYEYSAGSSREFEQENFGARAAGRSAISADGQKVVFVTTARSDLAGPGTPPLQVAVHDLGTDATELVSVEDEAATGAPAMEAGSVKPVPVVVQGSNMRGAVYTVGGPPAFETPLPYSPAPGLGASISADGSTVAWMGQEIGEQVRLLPGEAVEAKYSEPLWRRIGDGEQTPTRPVTGGSDPADSQCAANPESKLPEPGAQSSSDPCQGPFGTAANLGIWSLGDNVPQLSSDGYTIAFLANAPLIALGSDFGAGNDVGRKSDVYVANMHEGLSRVQALRPLTELASGNEADVATDGAIGEIAVSPDGGQVAFTARRTVFALGSPAYVSAPAAVAGMSELFDVDLANDTLTRVTRGYEGGPSAQPHEETGVGNPYGETQGALSPSFSEGGENLAFSSTASNLVYGDGNTPPLKDVHHDGSDAFVVTRIVFGSSPTPQVISPAPPGPVPSFPWILGVTAHSLANGTVVLYVEVPGGGQLAAAAISSVRVMVRMSAAHHGSQHSAHKTRTVRVATKVVTRTVASTKHLVGAGTGGLTTLTLKLAGGYTSLATQHGGLSAVATVTFSAPAHPLLRQRIALTFLKKPPPRKARPATRPTAGKPS